LFFFIALLCTITAFAQDGDTTIIQTFTHAAQNNPTTAYESPGRRWFNFPPADNGVDYQKILMYYNLKCFEDGTAGNLGFPCGEWDYLTYTYLFQHTGLLDSLLATHPTYLINNQDFDAAALTSQGASITHQYQEPYVQLVETLNEAMLETQGDAIYIAGPLTTNNLQRTQYLYRAEELTSGAFLASEPIQKIAFDFTGVAASFQFMKIKMALTTMTELMAIATTPTFTEVYSNDVIIDGTGWQEFFLETPFLWDGVSNLIIDISYTNAAPQANAPQIASIEYNYPCMSALTAQDNYIRMDWQDEVKVPAEAFANVNEEISIMFWNYGTADAQPQDGTAFEARGAQNQRILNVHLPWSNGRIYWDAGNNGGYDRIDKAAATADYEGKWNHWCFTKNTATGSMKMYKNGVLWHTGTNMDNTMQGITEFSLGGAVTWDNFYRGSFDEFAVFNVELDESTIASWMNQDLNVSHPYWSNLQVYYPFNNQDGEQIMDASGNNHHGWVHGNAARIAYRGEDLWRNSGGDYFKPKTQFFNNGEYVTSIQTTAGEWIEMIPPVSIVQYEEVNNTPAVISVQYDWYEQNSFTITADGDTINEVLNEEEYALNNTDFSYYQAPFEVVNRYELNRFITMYGIQLDLGDEGWTWVTDVTDWAPLLRDSVELEAGNWQELLDMKFVFIEGTPARDVLRVEKVWDTNLGLNNFDNVVVDKEIEKLPGEEAWKLVTTNTGHGFGADANNCGEFCSNIQKIEVNDQQQWQWDILQECATNPLYPQGGTWIYDRAGWCPGMNSTTKEFELTPHVGDGDSFTVDYNIEYDPYGNYVFFGTLIGYGPMHHAHDPEIDMITAPSDWKIHSRWNPMCDNPRFILRNKGSEPLTDLNIYFGVVGGVQQSFHWTGSIAPLASEEITLQCNDPLLWQGDDEELLTFYVQLGLSTDGADENNSNNYATSTFTRPPIYQYTDLDDNRLIVLLKTNDAYWQSSYTLWDINGNVIFSRDDFNAANTTYRDTLQLNEGCYRFQVRDSGEDGLSFFANDDGNGFCKLDKVQSLDFKVFDPDFGKEADQYFYFKTNLVGVDEVSNAATSLQVYPNPASDACTVNTTGFGQKMTYKLYNASGELVMTKQRNTYSASDQWQLDIQALRAGLYTLVASDEVKVCTVRVVVR
ncbi:MAG: T9SS type A sorting domain-containing protein, partial [Flavobacteriales bacterium]